MNVKKMDYFTKSVGIILLFDTYESIAEWNKMQKNETLKEILVVFENICYL